MMTHVRSHAVEDLMRMVGGVQWSEAWDDHSQTPEMLFATRDSAAFFGSFPQAFPPGAHWAYTSGSYQLLQHMLRCAWCQEDMANGACTAHWQYNSGGRQLLQHLLFETALHHSSSLQQQHCMLSCSTIIAEGRALSRIQS